MGLVENIAPTNVQTPQHHDSITTIQANRAFTA